MRPANSPSPIQRLFARELSHSHQLDLSQRPASLPSRDAPPTRRATPTAEAPPVARPDDLVPPSHG